MHILFTCFFKRGGVVVSDDIWVPFAEILPMYELELSMMGGAPEPDDDPPRILPTEIDFTECPWILDLLVPGARGGSVTSMMLPTCDEHTSVGVVDDDTDFMALWDELGRAREALADAAEYVDEEHFVVIVRGGEWTLINTGMPYDCYRACAKTASAVEFCREMNFAQSATYAVNLFTDVGAQQMAQWWKAKMTVLHGTWKEWAELDDDDELLVAPDPEEPGIIAELERGGNPRILRRIREIRLLSLY